MPDNDRVLSPAAAQAFYDRFGKKQDSQGFYEDSALDDLIVHAEFNDANSIFEFGCGTGKLADRLFKDYLKPSATYVGCDLSLVMVDLAKHRLEKFGRRAQVVISDGAIKFPLPDASVDRVVSCYVLDLLSKSGTRDFFSEAHRMLVPGGKACLAGLTHGIGPVSKLVSFLWLSIFRLRPSLVGGCRPVELNEFVDMRLWRVVHTSVVVPYGIPSEVLILEKL